MPNLREVECDKYERAWTLDKYRDFSPGATYVPLFLDMTQTMMRTSVLDAGCGAGAGAIALQAAGFDVTCCDLTDSGLAHAAQGFPFHTAALWEDLSRIVGFKDWVYCADVLEHIPPAFTMLAVYQMLKVARRGLFISVAYLPDVSGVWIGEQLHQTLQSFVTWRDQLSVLGRVVEARDLLNSGVFLVAPR